MTKSRTTSLWMLVAELQAQLESLGLSSAEADGVVTKKIRAYIYPRRVAQPA